MVSHKTPPHPSWPSAVLLPFGTSLTSQADSDKPCSELLLVPQLVPSWQQVHLTLCSFLSKYSTSGDQATAFKVLK